jgi:hypothetical protein
MARSEGRDFGFLTRSGRVPSLQAPGGAAGGGCAPQYLLINKVVVGGGSETQQCCVSTSGILLRAVEVGVIRVIRGEVFDRFQTQGPASLLPPNRAKPSRSETRSRALMTTRARSTAVGMTN